MADRDAVGDLGTTGSSAEDDTFSVVIDGRSYLVRQRALPGAELRELAAPPVGDDRDLYLEVPGSADRLVEDAELIDLRAQVHLFSVPKAIVAGSARELLF